MDCIDNAHMPLQKCISGEDVKNLSDIELLSVIIGTGCRDLDVFKISSDLYYEYKGLAGIYCAGLRDIASMKGIGLKKAVKILSALEIGKRLKSRENPDLEINSPIKVWKLLAPDLACLGREEFWAIILDSRNRVIKKSVVSVGILNEALIHPREIFREAIKELASSVIIAHNHPSGALVPSIEDISATKRIDEAGKIIGINLIDHVIITESSFLSMKEKGFF